MNRALLFFVAVLLLFTGSVIVYFASRSPVPAGGTTSEVDQDYVAPQKELTTFEFTDQLAKSFGSEQLDGKIWLGSFFFADCPSICVQQNIEVAKLHKRFRDQGVMVVNITVAPDNDPPHKLLTYANRFSADHETWKFLTGKELDYVIKVGHDIFGLPAANETHTSEVAVFDQNGKMHGTYNVMDGLEYAKCVKKVEELIAGDADPADGDSESEPSEETSSEESTSNT